MAITTRYFSTSSAGAADGTTWADRAALFSGGAWSTVITNFDFTSDSLLCYIGPGTYTITAGLTTTVLVGASDPTATTPLIFHGCDSSGTPLTPPDEGWTSAEPAWDDSSLPVIATTTNIGTSTVPNQMYRLLKFTASGRNNAVLDCGSATVGSLDWCVVTNSTANTSAVAVTGALATNSVFSCTGSSYNLVASVYTPGGRVANCRIVGVAGSSGNRNGLSIANSANVTGMVHGCTVIDVGGNGFNFVTTHVTNGALHLVKCLADGCGADGFQLGTTASPTGGATCVDCIATNNGAYGFDGGSSSHFLIHCRTRDNTSGSTTAMGNMPEMGTYTTDTDDASEYVDASGGDFRIKNTATIWGKGYGVSDEAAAASSGTAGVVGS